MKKITKNLKISFQLTLTKHLNIGAMELEKLADFAEEKKIDEIMLAAGFAKKKDSLRSNLQNSLMCHGERFRGGKQEVIFRI